MLIINEYIYIYIYIYMYVCAFIYQPDARAGCDAMNILKRSSIGLNSEFYFSYTGCHTIVKEPSLTYNLSRTRKRIIECIPFSGVITLREM